MELDTWLSIIGIVVSTILGLLGIYLAIRKKKYPGSISFIIDQTFALVDDFAGKMSSLDIIYKSQPLDKGVALFTGYLVNDGSLDITNSMVEEPLQCSLPGNCQFLEVEVTSKAKALDVQAKVVDSQTVSFELGLFRKGESFSFQALVLLDEKHTTKKVRNQLNNLSWYHRIANLGSICTREIPEQKAQSKKWVWIRRIVGIVGGAAYIGMGIGMLFSVGPMAEKPVLHYVVDSKEQYLFKPQGDGLVRISSLDSEVTQLVNLDDFLTEHTVKPVVSSDTKPAFMFISMMFILFGGGLFMIYTSVERDLRLYKANQLVKASKVEIPIYKEARVAK